MIPFVREFDYAYGRCDQVSPLIRRVIARNPGPFTYTGTGTYIVGRGEVAVIDPGPEDEAHLEAICAAVAGEKVTHILITHHHLDHSPLAAALKARTGAPVYGVAAPAAKETDEVRLDEGSDAFAPDIAVADGETIAGAGWTMTAISTPGHTSNHTCYALKEENALFTGDHVMGWSTTVISPPDGDVGAYMASLQRVADAAYATLWPTHGAPITEPAPFLAAYAAHRREREAQILGRLKAGDEEIKAMVPILYAAVDSRLHPAAARSVWAHLIDLERRGVVTAEGGPALGARYKLVETA
jgi:glyoxylase-like metal-dependent hydrolase (beta-lactamase superfamily II)